MDMVHGHGYMVACMHRAQAVPHQHILFARRALPKQLSNSFFHRRVQSSDKAGQSSQLSQC